MLISAVLLLAAVATASGQEQPCIYPRMDQVNAHVRAKAVNSAGEFAYQYLLQNQAPVTQKLIKFAVQAFSVDGAIVSQTSPRAWEGGRRISDTDLHVWNTFGQPRGLGEGESATGFGFARAALPAIVRFMAWGEIDPPAFEEGGAPGSCEGDDLLENSFKGSTTGPRPPPQNFVAIQFLNYLITLVHDSGQLGWIKVDGIQQSLLAKLTTAERKLEAGDTAVAKNVLGAFLNEVSAVACPDFTCPGTSPSPARRTRSCSSTASSSSIGSRSRPARGDRDARTSTRTRASRDDGSAPPAQRCRRIRRRGSRELRNCKRRGG